jgi:cytochrome c peroxidase
MQPVSMAGQARTRFSPISPRAISAPRKSTAALLCRRRAGRARLCCQQERRFVHPSRCRRFSPQWASAQSSAVDTRWRPLVAQNCGRFQVPTLRNVDKRPSPDFVKAYGHNGHFKSLKQIVHFYNTRDVLPRCAAHDPCEGTSCWPAPENDREHEQGRESRFVGQG